MRIKVSIVHDYYRPHRCELRPYLQARGEPVAEPSYGLKVVERRAGYVRQLEEYGGDWSMARYIEAVETSDEEQRAKIMQQILDYNREDLEATWAVFQWLGGLP